MEHVLEKVEETLTEIGTVIRGKTKKLTRHLHLDSTFGFASSVSPPGHFKLPLGLAINEEGDLVVADHDNHRVQVVDWDGNCKRIIKCKVKSGTSSDDDFEPTGPMDVIVSNDGSYYVIDEVNEQVLISNGSKVVFNFGKKDNRQPRGIALTKDGCILVTEWCDEKYGIRKYTTDGSEVGLFGVYFKGTEHPTLNMPLFLAVNSKNHIYVSDQGNDRVVVTDWNGEFLYEFGNDDIAQGRIHGPTGIDIDGEDNVYVCDPNQQKVIKYDSYGKYISETTLAEFGRPYAIAVSRNGPRRLAFTEHQHNLVRFIDL
ncbi:protein meiotic P26-like [Glandiceps talaboti]